MRFDLIMVGCQDRDQRAERAAVMERCGYGPTKVRFNGSEVAPPWRLLEPYGTVSRLAEFYAANAGYGLALPRTTARVTLRCGERRPTLSGGATLPLLLSDGAGPPARALALFEGSSWDESQVVWVRYGVACETTTEQLGFTSTYAVVDASELPVDASHFELLRTPALAASLADVKHDTRQLCRALLDNLPELTQPRAAELTSGCANFAGCLGCLFGSLVGMPWIGVLTGLAGNVMSSRASSGEEQTWRNRLGARLEEALKEP